MEGLNNIFFQIISIYLLYSQNLKYILINPKKKKNPSPWREKKTFHYLLPNSQTKINNFFSTSLRTISTRKNHSLSLINNIQVIGLKN